jgi:hypothetical protein
MKKTVLLLTLILVSVPLLAGAHTHKHHNDSCISISGNSGFDIVDGELILTHNDRWSDDRVVVTADGDLTINGDRIKVNKRERRLLKKMFFEAEQLVEMAEEISEDAERISESSVQFAMATISDVLKSLSDDDDDDDYDSSAKIEANFERDLEEIEEFAEKIEIRADRIVDIADELKETIPELEELDWFMDN